LANQTKPQRFGPPRDAIAIEYSALRVHDWAYVAGYWWRVVALAPSSSAFSEHMFTLHRPGQPAYAGQQHPPEIEQLTTGLRHAALFKRELWAIASDKRAKPQ
jgi:hypothetical protein